MGKRVGWGELGLGVGSGPAGNPGKVRAGPGRGPGFKLLNYLNYLFPGPSSK